MTLLWNIGGRRAEPNFDWQHVKCARAPRAGALRVRGSSEQSECEGGATSRLRSELSSAARPARGAAMDALMPEQELSSPFPDLPPEINVHILMYLDLQTMVRIYALLAAHASKVRTRRVSRAFAGFSRVYLGPGLICKLKYDRVVASWY